MCRVAGGAARGAAARQLEDTVRSVAFCALKRRGLCVCARVCAPEGFGAARRGGVGVSGGGGRGALQERLLRSHQPPGKGVAALIAWEAA
jgi:hypothetical protein